MDRRGWGLVIVAASVLALVSLASNATTMSQIEAQANTLLAVRRTFSQLLSTGTVWAGLAVQSGCLVRRPVQSVVAGVVALLTACVVHYGVGLALGMFDPTVWTENSFWFQLAAVVGGPLGLVGATARRSDVWGLVARFVIPAGAVLEPFVLRVFLSPTMLPWPHRVANVATGVLLLTAGTAACIWVFAAARRRRAAGERRVTAETERARRTRTSLE